MRSGPAAVTGVLLSLALVLPGCGEEGTAATGGEAPAKSQETAATSRAKSAVSLEARRCGRLLGELLDALESLGNTLAVGLSYEDYLTTTNRVRGAYAGVPTDRLSLACLGRVAGPAEGALNLHIDAVNAWGECLATASCNPESVEPELQRLWESAADRVSSAQSGLRRLG
jgi:hypothetical protein